MPAPNDLHIALTFLAAYFLLVGGSIYCILQDAKIQQHQMKA